MKNYKLIILLIVLFASCKDVHYVDYESEMTKLKMKKAQLEYLQQLYSVRQDIEYNEKVKHIDSLINIQITLTN